MATLQNTNGDNSQQPDNLYPELSGVAYMHTSVTMAAVARFAKTIINKYGIETVGTTYCIFRNESGMGS